MAKYKQSTIPTAKLQDLSQKELKIWLKKTYKAKLQGKSIVNKDIGIEIKFTSDGLGKISTNRRIGVLNASVVSVLDKALRNAEYNNFGDRKKTDKENVLGYLNFKVKIKVDDKVQMFRIAVKLKTDMKAYYNHNIYGIKK